MLHFALSSVDYKGEVKLLKCIAMIGSIHSMMKKYKLRNGWKYQQYRKASGYSGIKAALRCSSATRLAHKPLNASLRSFVRGLQGRSQALDALCNDWEYPLRKAWKYKLCNAWEYHSIAKQVATVASRLRFDALPPHALRTSL